MSISLRALCLPLLATVFAAAAAAQTVTVTISSDVVDIDWQTATIADLPGPDGQVSFSEAMIATNNTPGHQTVGFAIPQSDWTLQFLFPGRAVLTTTTGFFFRASDAVTVDGTTQTAFTGDTNPDGNEVVIYGAELYLNAPGCTLLGFDSTAVSVTDANGLVQGNTGTMNISLFDADNCLIQGNEGGTIKLDRSNDNVLVGNTVQRVRIWGFGPAQLATNNRIGGPTLAERNFITGFGSWNSEGLPSGTTVELFDTDGTVIENNYIGTTPDGLAQGSLASNIGIGFQGQNDGTLVRDNLIAGILGHGQGPHHAGQLFGWAVLFWGAGGGDGATFTGNTIGLDANGDPTLGSVWGIDVGNAGASGAGAITIGGPNPGDGNVIAGHIFNGVTVGRLTEDVRLSGNSIHSNGWLGVDLVPTSFGYGVTANDPLDADTGGNGLQNFPVLTLAALEGGQVHVKGTLHSSPLDSFTVELFASAGCDDSGFGEGELYLGATGVTTDAAGDAAFDVLLPPLAPVGWVVTATATLEPLGATSEFSACLDLVDGGSGDLGSSYCGPAVPNSTGLPAVIRATGSDVVADANFHQVAEQLPPNQFGYFLTSMTQGFVANPGGSQGNLCLGGTIGRFSKLAQGSGAGGTFGIQVDLSLLPPPLNVPVQPGDTWNFQAWYRDKNPGATSNFTDGREVVFQ